MGSPDHEYELTILGADFGAGDWSIDPMHAAFIGALGKAHGGGWRYGAGVDDDGAFMQRLQSAVVAKDHALDRGSVGDTDPDHLSFFSGICRRDCRIRAVDMLTCGAVPYRHLMSGCNQPGSHWTTHDAQTEEGNAHALLLVVSGFRHGTMDAWRHFPK